MKVKCEGAPAADPLPSPGGEGPSIALSIACVFCKDALAKAETVYCASCLAPHHEDCFRDHGRCATCARRDVVRAARPAPRPRRPWRAALGVLALAVAAAGARVASRAAPPALHVLAVHESNGVTVEVEVLPDERASVLALSAPVRVVWNVQLRPGARVERVILAGERSQQVTGLPEGTPVSFLDALIPYSPDRFTGYEESADMLRDAGDPELARFFEERLAAEGPGYDRALAMLEGFAGLRVASFQGFCSGRSFSVPPARAEEK